MPTESGYSNQKKKGQSQFKTIQSVGSSQFGAPIVQKSLYDVTELPQSIVSVSDIYGQDGQLSYWKIEILGHTAVVGNVLRMITGTLKSFEFEIVSIVDANNFYIFPISPTAPIAAETAKIMAWVTSKSDDEGNVVVNLGPAQFIKDSVIEQVTEDTVDPANNLAMPSSLFIYKDGTQYPVNIDTGTPANTVGIPVILTGASGPVNITAGDLNVQLTDLGANFDATRIGDGSGNYVGVNASNEALVHDTDLLAKLTSLEAKDFATQTTLAALLTELNLKADLTETQPVSMATLPLPTGSATEAKQDIGNSSLSSIDGKLTTLNATDFATSANQDTANTSLSTIAAKDFATQTTLNDFSNKSSSALVTVPFDEIVTTYVGATTDISTVVYKNASTTVATLTMSYDGSNRLIGVVRS